MPKKQKELPNDPNIDVRPTKVYQEFLCATSGGGCGGYTLVKLNTAFDGVVKIICPNCKHEHGRIVENGHIQENWHGQSHYLSQRNDKTSHEIISTMAAFSMTPRTNEYLLGFTSKNERTAPVIKDIKKDLVADFFLRESFQDRHGGKK